MEKTLILKHISGMLCLLISYSKFTRTRKRHELKNQGFSCKIKLLGHTKTIRRDSP